jgi:hypothetical protein
MQGGNAVGHTDGADAQCRASSPELRIVDVRDLGWLLRLRDVPLEAELVRVVGDAPAAGGPLEPDQRASSRQTGVPPGPPDDGPRAGCDRVVSVRRSG